MKKKLLTILLAILISISFVLFKHNFSQNLPNKEFGTQELLVKGNVNNLYIGSSLFKQGIDPNEIGDNDYILAYNGNEPSHIEEELDYLIRNDVKINNIYMDMYAWSIARNPWMDDLTILWDIDMKATNNIYNDLSSDSDLRYAYEYYISSNNDLLLTYPISINILNNYYYKGGNTITSISYGKDYLDNLPLHDYDLKNLELGAKQIESIKQIKDLCNTNNINLIFIETPKYYRDAQLDSYLFVMDKYKNLLDSLDIKYILAEDIDIDNTNSEYFIDLLHMSSLGSKEYTKKLIKFLNEEYN